MARNMMTVLREQNENFFSKSFKTEIYEYPNYNSWGFLPRYKVTILVADGEVQLSAYPEKKPGDVGAFYVEVRDPNRKGKEIRYMARYFGKSNKELEERLQLVYNVLCDLVYSDPSIDDVAYAFVDNLPWM